MDQEKNKCFIFKAERRITMMNTIPYEYQNLPIPGGGYVTVSEAYGEQVTYEKIPVLIHGNLGGRGTGERLIVDRMDSN